MLLCSIPPYLQPFLHQLETVSDLKALSALFDTIYAKSDITNSRFHRILIFTPAHRCFPDLTPESALREIQQYAEKIWENCIEPLLEISRTSDPAKAEAICAQYGLSEIYRLYNHARKLMEFCEEAATDPCVKGDVVFHLVDASFARVINFANTREDFTDEESDALDRWLTKAWKWRCEKENTCMVFVYLPEVFSNSKEHLLHELNWEKHWLEQTDDEREFYCNRQYRLASELMDDLKSIIRSVGHYNPGVPVLYVYNLFSQKLDMLTERLEVRGKYLIDTDTSAVITSRIGQSYEVCFVFWPKREF